MSTSAAEPSTPISTNKTSLLSSTLCFRTRVLDNMSQVVATINSTIKRLLKIVHPCSNFTFPEYAKDREGFFLNLHFSYIECYLNSIYTAQAKNLNEGVTDEFEGGKMWWTLFETPQEDQKRYFRLTYHRPHCQDVMTGYLLRVLSEGKSIKFKETGPAFYINNGEGEWTNSLFMHLATFDTLNMDPHKKIDIVNDLNRFSNSKDYYDKACMVWNRGYLLSGPLRFGKSRMITAMANLLEYDIYEISLSSVKNNNDLVKMLGSTSEESIIVFESIKEGDNAKFEEVDWVISGCGGGRIFVFNMEKLDLSLISERVIRMINKHIELKEVTDVTPNVGESLKANMDGHWEYMLVELN